MQKGSENVWMEMKNANGNCKKIDFNIILCYLMAAGKDVTFPYFLFDLLRYDMIEEIDECMPYIREELDEDWFTKIISVPIDSGRSVQNPILIHIIKNALAHAERWGCPKINWNEQYAYLIYDRSYVAAYVLFSSGCVKADYHALAELAYLICNLHIGPEPYEGELPFYHIDHEVKFRADMPVYDLEGERDPIIYELYKFAEASRVSRKIVVQYDEEFPPINKTIPVEIRNRIYEKLEKVRREAPLRPQKELRKINKSKEYHYMSSFFIRIMFREALKELFESDEKFRLKFYEKLEDWLF